jgi:hypothetical protein
MFDNLLAFFSWLGRGGHRSIESYVIRKLPGVNPQCFDGLTPGRALLRKLPGVNPQYVAFSLTPAGSPVRALLSLMFDKFAGVRNALRCFAMYGRGLWAEFQVRGLVAVRKIRRR